MVVATLTDVDNAMVVAKVGFRPFHDLLGILEVLLVAVILVEHARCAEHCTLIVGGTPLVLALDLLCCRIPNNTVPYLARGHIVGQCITLCGIEVARLLEILFATTGKAEIACGHFRGTGDA